MAIATSVLFPFLRVGFIFYFLPSIVAVARGKHDLLSLFLLNVFLGWTLTGWAVAMIWAARDGRARQHVAPARKTAQFPPAIRLGSAGQRRQPRCQSQPENPRMLPLAPAPLPQRACDPDT
jgi:hypothetical protein